MSWRDLFRQPHPTLPPDADWPPTATDEWRVGDHAECVVEGRWFMGGLIPAPGPQLGETRVVIGVSIGGYPGIEGPVQFLAFARYAPRSYVHTGFRKVTPRADELDRAEPAFLHDLKPQQETV